MGLPYPYYFDDYYQWSAIAHWKAKRSFFARRLESAIIRGAERVIVPNEFMEVICAVATESRRR